MSYGESEEHKKMGYQASETDTASFIALANRRLDDYFALASEYTNLLFESDKKRDIHIGKILETAEERIRSRYAKLRDKEPLKLAVRLGFAHNPENYTRVPTVVHELLPEYDDFFDEIHLGYINGKTFDELKLLMLMDGVYNLSSQGYLKPELTETQIKQMSFDELVHAVQTYTIDVQSMLKKIQEY